MRAIDSTVSRRATSATFPALPKPDVDVIASPQYRKGQNDAISGLAYSNPTRFASIRYAYACGFYSVKFCGEALADIQAGDGKVLVQSDICPYSDLLPLYE